MTIEAATRTLASLIAAGALASGCGSSDVTRPFSVPWHLLRVAADGRQVFVQYEGGVCDRLHHIEADERRASVTVAVYLVREKPKQPCILLLKGGQATVHLSVPLGRRRLRHAPALKAFP